MPGPRQDVGPLGLEARHVWNDTLVLNTPRAAGLPAYRLRAITGLRDRPDLLAAATKLVGRWGESGGDGSLAGVTVTYEGDVIGQSLLDLRLAVRAIEAATLSPAPGRMRIVPDDALPYGHEWGYEAEVMAFSCPDVQVAGPGRQPTPWVRPFTLALRLPDARKTRPEVLHVPASDVITVARQHGNAPADVTLTVHGPSAPRWTVQGTQAGTTRTLTFDHELAAGQACVISFADATAHVDGLDVTGSLDWSTSTWWDAPVEGLRPGSTVIETIDAASVEASWQETDW